MQWLDSIVLIVFIVCAVIVNECDMTIKDEDRYLTTALICVIYALLRLGDVL